jgi:hypothetical protein
MKDRREKNKSMTNNVPIFDIDAILATVAIIAIVMTSSIVIIIIVVF